MDLLNCGTAVETNNGKIKATITGITIRFAAVAYELSYFHNGKKEEVWCNESEFTVTNGIKLQVGFKTIINK